MIKRSGKVEVRISNIVWDTDDYMCEDFENRLPTDIQNLIVYSDNFYPVGQMDLGFDIDTLTGEILNIDSDEFEEVLSDYLSDKYGWCVDRFEYEISPSFLNYLNS